MLHPPGTGLPVPLHLNLILAHATKSATIGSSGAFGPTYALEANLFSLKLKGRSLLSIIAIVKIIHLHHLVLK